MCLCKMKCGMLLYMESLGKYLYLSPHFNAWIISFIVTIVLF